MPRNLSGCRRAIVVALPALLGSLALAGLTAPQRAAAQLNIAVEARVTLLAKAYNTTAQQLFTTLAATPGNVVFSPYSIGTAMSMALVGARGDTASEMARVMSERMANEAIDTANAEMMAILAGYDHSADPPTCPPNTALKNGKCDGAPSRDGKCTFGMQPQGGRCVGDGTPPKSAKLLIANGLMLSKDGDIISADYAETLKTRYGADVFRSANLDDVNNWVSRHTEGRIPKLFDQLEVDAGGDPAQRGLFQGAVGIDLQSEPHRRRELPSHADPGGAGSHDEPARQLCAGVARGLSRHPVALPGG